MSPKHWHLISHLLDCTFLNVKSVTLQVPLLEVVSISYSPFYHTLLAEIKFYALRLEIFCYSGYMSDTILLEAHSVAFADIALYDDYKKSLQEIGIFVCKLLSINPESHAVGSYFTDKFYQENYVIATCRFINLFLHIFQLFYTLDRF